MGLNSDDQWESYGQRDPYYGVLTTDRFRNDRLDAASRAEFFESGEKHIDYVMKTIRSVYAPEFRPRRVLDFGAGVGRCTIPFAKIADEVVAVDVSPSMLREAERNCTERSLRNVRFVGSDDTLSAVTGKFDIVHGFMVFQHIPSARGRAILARMLDLVADGGIIVVDLLYHRSEPALLRALGQLRKHFAPLHYLGNKLHGKPWRMPLMEKNLYSLNEYVFAAQTRGCHKLHVAPFGRGAEHVALVVAQKSPLGDPYLNQDFF